MASTIFVVSFVAVGVGMGVGLLEHWVQLCLVRQASIAIVGPAIIIVEAAITSYYFSMVSPLCHGC
jgi:hypothetical protein